MSYEELWELEQMERDEALALQIADHETDAEAMEAHDAEPVALTPHEARVQRARAMYPHRSPATWDSLARQMAESDRIIADKAAIVAEQNRRRALGKLDTAEDFRDMGRWMAARGWR